MFAKKDDSNLHFIIS